MLTGRQCYWLTLGAIAVLLFVYAERRDLYGVYQRYQNSENHVRDLEGRKQDLQAAEASLQQRIRHLNDDPLELEAEIRRGKHLVREGETIYRIELPEDAHH